MNSDQDSGSDSLTSLGLISEVFKAKSLIVVSCNPHTALPTPSIHFPPEAKHSSSQDIPEEKDMGQVECVFSIAQFISVLKSTLLNRHEQYSSSNDMLLCSKVHIFKKQGQLSFTPPWLLGYSKSLAISLKHRSLLLRKFRKWHIGWWLCLGSTLASIVCWFELFPAAVWPCVNVEHGSAGLFQTINI